MTQEVKFSIQYYSLLNHPVKILRNFDTLQRRGIIDAHVYFLYIRFIHFACRRERVKTK